MTMINDSHVFVDTSALIALMDRRDSLHNQINEFLIAQQKPLQWVTSNLVLAEFCTFFSRNYLLPKAIEFQQQMFKNPHLKIVWVDQVLHQEGSSLILKYADKCLSFTDAVSFAIMKKEKLTHAITFDDDFIKAGFEKIP